MAAARPSFVPVTAANMLTPTGRTKRNREDEEGVEWPSLNPTTTTTTTTSPVAGSVDADDGHLITSPADPTSSSPRSLPNDLTQEEKEATRVPLRKLVATNGGPIPIEAFREKFGFDCWHRPRGARGPLTHPALAEYLLVWKDLENDDGFVVYPRLTEEEAKEGARLLKESDKIQTRECLDMQDNLKVFRYLEGTMEAGDIAEEVRRCFYHPDKGLFELPGQDEKKNLRSKYLSGDWISDKKGKWYLGEQPAPTSGPNATTAAKQFDRKVRRLEARKKKTEERAELNEENSDEKLDDSGSTAADSTSLSPSPLPVPQKKKVEKSVRFVVEEEELPLWLTAPIIFEP